MPINTTAEGCAFTIRARYDGACLKSLTGGGGYFPNTGVLEITTQEMSNKVIEIGNIVQTGNWNSPQRGRVYSTDGISPCLNTCDGGGNEPKIVEQNNMEKIYKIRKLTPRECFRLMDVSDEDIDKIQAAEISASQQYKMAGNSIVVACLEHIFKNLFDHELR